MFSHNMISYGKMLLRASQRMNAEMGSVLLRKHYCVSLQQKPFTPDFFFRQFLDYQSYTYTYLLADSCSKEAVIIDPVLQLAQRDAKQIQELGLCLKYAMNTHMHADHITGTGCLKKLLPDCKSLIAKASGAEADVYVVPGEIVKCGRHELEVRSTPGHTNGCVTYVIHEQGIAFTGDALLIRGCGRTDFQEGSSKVLYDSVYKQILSLPGYFKLFPAHDYNGKMCTTVEEEKLYNPRLTKPLDEFVKIMENLNLPYPKMIDQAIPANKRCGLHDLPEGCSLPGGEDFGNRTHLH